MITNDTLNLPELGVLRGALLIGSLINILVPAVGLALITLVEGSDSGLLAEITYVITPVMAPLFIVVIFFDYVMSRLRAGDTEADPEECAYFASVARVEGFAITLSLLFWVPYFVWRL